MLIALVFVAVYAGMALGRWPGLRIDRTGIALLGAIVLIIGDRVSQPQALAAINFATLAILLGLMLLSAQYAASGLYDWCAWRIAATRGSATRLLAATVIVTGLLSAILANDVVVFAMTPLLCDGVRARGLDPRPYLIALAGAANAGSAATMIGNPQNILISQSGALQFWPFALVCAVPALFALASVYMVVRWRWRHELSRAASVPVTTSAPAIDRGKLGKALAATVALLALFAAPISQAHAVLIIGAVLLVSRQVTSRELLAKVDWQLLVLFAGLFIVTASLSQTGLPAWTLTHLRAAGLAPSELRVLAPIAVLGSNTIGNVPAVTLLLALWPQLGADALYALAVFSTLAGNLLLVGSLANLIVAERAAGRNIVLGFVDHARCGIPMTLLALVFAYGWFALRATLGS